MILAGDVGGTKSNLGLFDTRGGKLVRALHKHYASKEHAGFEEIVRDFVANQNGAAITAACFGIAGAVVSNRVRAANLPWVVDGANLASVLKLSRVKIINDVEATAYGISALDPTEWVELHAGEDSPHANRAVIAAGTGLGEAVLVWDGSRHVPMATEAGHTDFAPHTLQQADLWKFIKSRGEFVSAESVLSGRGFQVLHEFLAPDVRHPGFENPAVDPAPEITRRGMTGECAPCAHALDLWVEIYGAEAGNLALRSVARGGMYVAGGIAVKILPKLRDGRFAAAMKHKEKLADFLDAIPIRVVLNEECPMLGAAYVAWKGL